MNTQEAFDTLLQQLQQALKEARSRGAQSFQQGQDAEAQAAARQVEAIGRHLDSLRQMQKQWEGIVSGAVKKRGRKPGKAAPKRKHLSPGIKTPGPAFRLPILQALQDLGGRGAVDDVLQRVETTLRGQLNEQDRQLLKDGRALRWRNTAQWERNAMVKEGLLSADSPRGVWEITEAGRRWLRDNR